MIEVQIKGFQSIQSVDFSVNGLTVLVGENDIGKSSVFRAIHSILRNRSGEGFISKGFAKSNVSLSTAENTIEWEKPRKSGSEYHLDGVSYSKVGRKSPEFVSELGFGTIELKSGHIDPHFSSQGEAPFLIKSSGQLLTDFFSELLKFGPLAKASHASAKELRQSNSDIRLYTQEIERIEDSLLKFDPLPLLEQGVVSCNNLLKLEQQLESTLVLLKTYVDLDRLLQTVPSLKFDLDSVFVDLVTTYKLHRCLQKYIALDTVLDLEVPEVSDTTLKQYMYLELCKVIGSANIEEETYAPYFSELEYLVTVQRLLELSDVIDFVCSEGSFQTIQNLYSSLMYWYSYHEELLAVEKIAKCDSVLVQLEAEFHEGLAELGICPLCERHAQEGKVAAHV
jgi:hypothetical protein